MSKNCVPASAHSLQFLCNGLKGGNAPLSKALSRRHRRSGCRSYIHRSHRSNPHFSRGCRDLIKSHLQGSKEAKIERLGQKLSGNALSKQLLANLQVVTWVLKNKLNHLQQGINELLRQGVSSKNLLEHGDFTGVCLGSTSHDLFGDLALGHLLASLIHQIGSRHLLFRRRIPNLRGHALGHWWGCANSLGR